MRSSFVARPVNPPFGDAGVYVLVRHRAEALLFDAGDLSPLATPEIGKLTHVFVSHTHVDHFIGYDLLLRVLLRRERGLEVYGPEGIIANVRGKLAGYTWNLVEEDYPFSQTIHEVTAQGITSVTLRAATRFAPEPAGQRPFAGALCETPYFAVSAAIVSHQIPCLAFTLEEPSHLNVKPDELARRGWPVGPWLNHLKDAIRAGAPLDTPIAIESAADSPNSPPTVMSLGALREQLVVEAPGQKLAYVVDVRFDRDNVERLVSLIRDADLLYCEAPFLDREREDAFARYHLTARQAGTLARLAGVKRLETLHYSPRYLEEPQALADEAERAFQGEIERDTPA